MPLSSVRSAVEQLLLPAECLVCHGLLNPRDATRIVCPLCRQRWRAVRPPWCERCGQPEPHFGPCRLCHAWVPAFERVRSAVWLDLPARKAVHALKYEGLARVARDLAMVMTRHLPAPPKGAALVPIPGTSTFVLAGQLAASSTNDAYRATYWATTKL